MCKTYPQDLRVCFPDPLSSIPLLRFSLVGVQRSYRQYRIALQANPGLFLRAVVPVGLAAAKFGGPAIIVFLGEWPDRIVTK